MTKSLLPMLALALSLPLAAQRTQAGVQAAVVFPQSDLRSNVDGAQGLSVGVHLGINLQGGSELRPRLDYVQCDTQAFHALTFGTTSRSVHGVALGADYLRFFETGNRGAYALAGAAIHWWSASDAVHGSTHETAPGLRLGVGFRFNSQVGAEITYGLGRFRSDSGTAGSIEAGLNYRF